jgi:hypothetical protein
MKTTASRKPRNPFAVAPSPRRAGPHRPGAGALRQRAREALRRELDTVTHGP